MKRWKSYQISIFVIFCICINLIGKTAATTHNLPVWLDSVGTGMAAYGIGPLGGAIIGAASNIIYGCNTFIDAMYALINIIMGIIFGLFARKGYFESTFKMMTLGMIVAIAATVFSMPLNFILYDGNCGNIWGDGIRSYLVEHGFNTYMAAILGEFYIDFLDKFITAIVVFILVHSYRNLKRKSADATGSGTSKDVLAVVICAICVSFAVSFGANVKAAEQDSDGDDYDTYVSTTYDTSSGLPGGEANDITQDTKGTLYVGTYGGLYQYDGDDFELMDDLDTVRNVNCLYADEEGRILVGTNDSGLSVCVDNEVIEEMDADEGLPANSVRCITENSNGYYYIGTSDSLAVLELTGGLKVDAVFDDVKYPAQLSRDSYGHVAAVDSNGRLVIFEDLDIVINTMPDNKDSYYEAAAFGDDGTLYASTSDGLVLKYVLEENKLTLKTAISISPLANVHELNYVSEKGVFISADNGAGYIGTDGKFKQINTGDFDKAIYHTMFDYQGNLWIASTRLGLLKLCPSSFQEVFEQLGIEESVANAVTFWNDKYYVGTDDGLVIINKDMNKRLDESICDELSGTRVRNFVSDSDNRLWISTYGLGVIVLDKNGNETRYTSEDGLVSDKVRLVLPLSDGSYFFGHDQGITFLRNGKVSSTITADDGLTVPMILSAVENEDGTVLAGTDGGGLVYIKDEKIVRTFTKKDGLSSEIILRIKRTSKNNGYYLVTSNGLCYMDEEYNTRLLDKFPYYNNYDVIATGDGDLWVTGSNGIYIVNETELLSGEDFECDHIDSKKGMRQTLTANSSNCLTSGGRLLLCGNTGITSVYVKKYNESVSTYHITVDDILVDGVRYKLSADNDTDIPRGSTKLEITPRVINYSTNDPYVSVYLDGFDKEPTIVLQSELSTLVYTNLSSGTYTFHMAVLDNRKENVIEESVYTIVKESELYDLWYFKVYFFSLTAILAAYIGWFIARTQIQRMITMQRQEIENLKLKQSVDTAVAADNAKSRFLAQMSHEIRTPINAVLGMNELIMRESKDDQVLDYAENIENAGKTLLSLVNSILDFSKIENGKLELVNVDYETNSLISNLENNISVRAQDKGLAFKLDIDPELPTVMYGDDVRVSQIILNLLTNAVKYTKQGTVNFTMKKKAVEGEDVLIYVEVKDTGIGIKQEDMKDLFTSFKRLEEKKNRNIEGTGLGMSIVVNLLDLMESKLSVDSVYGEGSTFSFVLRQKIVDATPLGTYSENAKLSAREIDNSKYPFAPEAKLLVVDDNPMNLKVIEGLLKRNGIKPTTVLTGMEAVKLVSENDYHIVFIDHMMPEMDGIETLHKMQSDLSIKEDMTVIALTANAIVGVRDMYISEGFDDYLSKPINVKELEKMLIKYLPEEIVSLVSNNQPEDAGKAEDAEQAAKSGQTSNQGQTIDEVHTEQDETSSDNADESEKSGIVEYLKKNCADEIDTATGLMYCGDMEEFYEGIIDEYISGDKTADLDRFFGEKDYENYRINVHALKSTSLTIGAATLSEHAKAMEFALKDNDIAYHEANHEKLMEEYRNLLEKLKGYKK